MVQSVVVGVIFAIGGPELSTVLCHHTEASILCMYVQTLVTSDKSSENRASFLRTLRLFGPVFLVRNCQPVSLVEPGRTVM